MIAKKKHCWWLDAAYLLVILGACGCMSSRAAETPLSPSQTPPVGINDGGGAEGGAVAIDPVNAEGHDQIRRFLNEFMVSLAFRPEYRKHPEVIGHNDVISEFQNAFETKVLGLKEFGGAEDQDKFTWSPMELKLLKMLREARKSNPFFTLTEFSLKDRCRGLENHWWPSEHQIQPPKEVTEAYNALDDTLYKETAAAFAKWEEEQVRNLPLEQRQNVEVYYRMITLLNLLESESRYEKLTASQQKALRGALCDVDNAFYARRQGFVGRTLPAQPFPADSLPGLYWTYVQVAKRSDPFFAKLENTLSFETLVDTYSARRKAGRPAAEKQALDAFLKALDQNLAIPRNNQGAAHKEKPDTAGQNDEGGKGQ